MPKIFHLSKAGARLLYKIRHHKGHGIHSPFVFNFITKVIEEKTQYHAYEDVRNYLSHFPDISFRENKTHRLLLKVVNYFNIKKIVELGSGTGINTLYMTVTASDIECLSVELSPEKYNKAQMLYNEWNRNILQSKEQFPLISEKKDCIFVDLKNYKVPHNELIVYLISLVHKDSVIIIDGIRTNRKLQTLWRMLVQHDETIVSLDLFHIGILFFDKKYYKRNYKLSF